MPKWSSGLARQLRRDDFTLKASGAQTSSTTGAAVELGDQASATVTVDVTAASGTTPTLLVEIEGSADGTNWHKIATIGNDGVAYGNGTNPANITGVATKRATIPAARHMRYKSTIGGDTPSFTYSVTVDAA